MPTTNILLIAGCLGFVVKLHRLSSFYEQSFLALFTCSREGTQAETLLQPLRRLLRTSAVHSLRKWIVENSKEGLTNRQILVHAAKFVETEKVNAPMLGQHSEMA